MEAIVEKPPLGSLSTDAFLEIYWALEIYGAKVDLEEPMHAMEETLAAVRGYSGEAIDAEFRLRMERGSAGRYTSDVLLLKAYVEAAWLANIEPTLCSEEEYQDRLRNRDALHGQVLARMYTAKQ